MSNPCSECRKAPAVTTTVTGRAVCQSSANRLQGAAAGSIVGGPAPAVVTGVAASKLTGLSTAFPDPSGRLVLATLEASDHRLTDGITSGFRDRPDSPWTGSGAG